MNPKPLARGRSPSPWAPSGRGRSPMRGGPKPSDREPPERRSPRTNEPGRPSGPDRGVGAGISGGGTPRRSAATNSSR
ncbi:hypothetical protein AKJ08_1482 [Vulgatibacter incomptus]|uniref:Uncharacterized protein n=1 Tax=Vulgatibacter incomptus TaxID=1391653 RepID=A0A0K1PC50_9BACT|nr:hypothetical protein AKJ08_1482 [Vulgatibacter incomptus]